MDSAHVHLLITHLPIIGSILGGIVLIQGIWRRSNTSMVASYSLFIISAIGAGVAYLTGEGAEEIIEEIPGVAKNAIGPHEDFAMYALISLIILGVLSFVGIYLSWIKSNYIKTMGVIILLLSLVSFGLVARTGYLGGQIRHSEIGTQAGTSKIDGD
jgi:uncharacterized membrane protein